jgi:hypothetical protein
LRSSKNLNIWIRFVEMAVHAGLIVMIWGCGGGGGGTTSTTASSTTGSSSGMTTTTGQGGNSSTSTTWQGGATTGTGGATTSTGGATTTGSGCVPKTCLTLAVELAGNAGPPTPDACGVLSDGCSNFIDCGGCDNPDQACGKGYPTECVTGGSGCRGVPAENPGVEHLCGGGCALQKNESGYCSNWPGYSLYVCTNKTNQPPMVLVPQCHTVFPNMPSDTWCCP